MKIEEDWNECGGMSYQTVKFIYQLNDTDNLAKRIFDCHAQNGFVIECWTIINTLIKTGIIISIRYIHSLVVREKWILGWKSLNNIIKKNKLIVTSPVVATWPVIPILIGNRDSNGLVRVLLSSSAISFDSKSKTLEKLPFDASCTSKIYKITDYHQTEKPIIKECQCHTCTRWQFIKLCICVKILSTICSIVLCSSNIIRAKSNSTWFRLTSSWDFSYSCAFLKPIPQNCKYEANICK